LEQYGALSGNLVERIVRLLSDKDDATASTAASALADSGTNAVLAVAALTRAFKDPRENVRNNAAVALGRIGPAAKPAIPALETLMRQSEGGLKLAACRALWLVDGRLDVVPVLMDRLRDASTWSPIERLNPADQRLFIIRCLGEIGPPAQAAIAKIDAGNVGQ
jgi:HEAT repeat protein